MADPSNFVNFSDFLGLNPGVGESMGDSLMAGEGKLRDEAKAATDARFSAAKEGQGAYEASGERERKGLASYGEFMASLKDPKLRQALMEKTYGKGRVSALDMALTDTATAGRMGEAQKGLRSAQQYADEGEIRNPGRAAHYQGQRDAYATQDADYEKKQQDARDLREKDRLGREYALSEFDDDVRNTGFGGMGEATSGMSRRDRRLALNRMTRTSGDAKLWTRPDGTTNWDVYHAQRGIRRVGKAATEGKVRQMDYVAQATSPAPSGQRAQSWGDYYSQNRKK